MNIIITDVDKTESKIGPMFDVMSFSGENPCHFSVGLCGGCRQNDSVPNLK